MCSRGFGAALRWGMLLALPTLLVAWARPDLGWAAAAAASSVLAPIVAAATVRAWWRSRALLPALRARLRQGGAMSALGDELTTWLELDAAGASVDGRGARRGMLGWLERDVFERLQPRRTQALRAAALPRLGRWRWLAIALLLLLVAWLLSPWLQPPWSGALGGASTPAAAPQPGEEEPDDGDAEPDDELRGQSGDGPDDEPAEPRDEPGTEPVPVGGADEEAPPEPTEEPPPLVDRPADRRFVLPDFIGDGPTRRQRMRAAELEQPAPGGAPRAQAARAAGDASSPPPPPQRDAFERAAEKALRSRHVPERERAIVRRFFDALQQKGKGG